MRFRVPIRSAACGLTLGLAQLLGGCAHSDTAADRHFAELRDAVGKEQTDQDRNVASGFFEPGAAESKPAATNVQRSAPAPTQRRSVSIGEGDASEESDDPNDPTARPEIRLQGAGSGAVSRPLRGKSARGRGEARVEPSEEAPQDASRPSILDPEAKKAYDAALSLATSRQYDRALEALSAFLVRYPDHPYAENALYWRGECYFARGEFLRAAEQFEAVLARFGGGNKAADALLKIGVSHARLGSPERAREYWDRLRRDYPRSEATKRIPEPETSARGTGPKESR
jgi:tol-pal system protein YbgF